MASGQGVAPGPLTRAGSARAAGSSGPGWYARRGPGQPAPPIPGSVRVARSQRRVGEDSQGGSTSATSDSLLAAPTTAFARWQPLQSAGPGHHGLGLSASHGAAPCATVAGSEQLAGAGEASGLRAAAKVFTAPESAAPNGKKPRGRPPGTRRGQTKTALDSQQSSAAGLAAAQKTPTAAAPEGTERPSARRPLHAEVMRASGLRGASPESREHVRAALRLAALQQGADSVLDWSFDDSHAQEAEALENLVAAAASRDRGQSASTSSSRRHGARSAAGASGTSIEGSMLEDALLPTVQLELTASLPHSHADPSLRLIGAAHAASPGWATSPQISAAVVSTLRVSSASPSATPRLSAALPSATSTFASGGDASLEAGIDGVSQLPWFAGIHSAAEARPVAAIVSNSSSSSSSSSGSSSSLNAGGVNGSFGIATRPNMATPLQQQQQQQQVQQQGASGVVNGSRVEEVLGDKDLSGDGNKGLGFVKKVTRGNVTWVRLTRREEEEEEDEGEAEEGEGEKEEVGEGPAGVVDKSMGKEAEGGKTRRKAGEMDATHAAAASSDTSAGAPATRRGPGRPRLPRADVSDDWRARNEVEADDVDIIMSRLEMKYHPLQDMDVLKRNVKLLLGLGARRGQVMRLIGRQPDLLSRCVQDEAEALAAVLIGFQVPRTAMLRALGKSLDCLAAEPVQVEGVLGYLDKELGVNNLGRVVATSPHLLGQSVQELVATVTLLEGGLEVDDVGAALEKNPALLGWGKQDVEEKVAALGSLMGGGGAEEERGEASGVVAVARKKRVVREMVCNSAQLMLASPHDAMETYGRLVRLLGEENASRVAAAQPQVLAMDGEEVEASLAQLIAVFGQPLAAMMLEENGFLVRRKWAKTQTKLAFLTEEMGRDVAQVAAWPKVLTFNLQTRLQRRYAALQEQLGPGAGSKDSLRTIFGCPDSVFERRFGVKLPPIVKGKRGRKPKNQEEPED